MTDLAFVYNNSNITDEDLIVHALKASLGDPGGPQSQTNEMFDAYESVKKMAERLKGLAVDKTNLARPTILPIFDFVESIEHARDHSFDRFCNVVRIVKNSSLDVHVYAFVICFCRTKWEKFYKHRIVYEQPAFVLQNNMRDGWYNFLKSLDTCPSYLVA